MNQAMSIVPPVPVDRVPADLEGKLVWMTKFGKPSVYHSGDGFWAQIQMHVSAQGATFKIDSDMRHGSPTSAVDQCIQRMLEALSTLNRGG